ncbi:MAG: DUF6152 family protein, partial [Pseudomonadota bacterium]|nr:DUF6152 family protein [Pseudomonadota bacterium]
MKIIILMTTGLAALAVWVPTLAHHGFAAYSNERVTVQATMTELRFVNPHVQLYFDVTNADGEIEHWQAELTAPNKLARGGWTKNTLRPADQIQISGEIARNGGRSIRIREIITANGESLPLWEIL